MNKIFKVVCGAGNEDPEEVEFLSYIYTIAGADIIDLSANVSVIDAAKRGVNRAMEEEDRISPCICVSLGISGDPHIRKAVIDKEKCIMCLKCEKVCQQNAISVFSVDQKRCIGCGSCYSVCDFDAILFYDKKMDLNEVLPEILNCGIDMIELHSSSDNDDEFMEKWSYICNSNKHIFLSICLDRSHLSDTLLVERIKNAIDISGRGFIVQADGAPMSGSSNTYNTTLQAIAIADIVHKAKLSVKILLSGGTNFLTRELADLCLIDYYGISIGTYARNIVKGLQIDDAIEAAKELVDRCKYGY